MNALKNNVNFHCILTKLFDFWGKFNCILVPPCQTEISSAIFHPNSFFGIIGDAKYNIMYFQPQFPIQSKNIKYNTQNAGFLKFQVVLKSNIDMPQQLFLDSLRSLGFDLLNTNIFFENDYFENFAFRMTANGYMIYFNGIYIAKMHYVQNIGCCDFNLVPLYISYDLDKILMLLQGENDIWSISWNGCDDANKILYRDVMFETDRDNCKFISNDTTNEIIFNEFENCKNIALKLLDSNTVISAYIFILKAKYCLDILNFRNYITFNNRINYNTILRDLIDRCCKEYIKNKQVVE